ncbi:MAG: ATP-binding protein [Bacteroidales bacterium]
MNYIKQLDSMSVLSPKLKRKAFFVKTVSVIKRSTKRYIYLTIILLYVILSSLYIGVSAYHLKRTRDILVNQAVNQSNQKIYSKFNSINTAFVQLSTLSTNNDFFTKVLESNDREAIKSFLDPFAQELIRPIGAFMVLYDSSENLTYQYNYNDHEVIVEFNSNDSTETGMSESFLLASDGLYYYTKKQIEGYGMLILGIRDDKGLAFINDENLAFFTIIDTNIVSNPSHNINGERLKSYVIRTVNSKHLASLKREDLLLDYSGENKIFNQNSKYYTISTVSKYYMPDGTLAASSNLVVDISDHYNAYIRSLIYGNIIVLSILLLVILTISLAHKRIFSFITDLRTNFEERFYERSKEIIDTNRVLHQIFNSTTNGVRIIDCNFNVIRVNDAFVSTSGFARSELEDKKCFEVFPSTSCYTDNCPLYQIKRRKETIQRNEMRFKKCGKRLTCMYQAKPFYNNNKEFSGIIEDFKDITYYADEKEKDKQMQDQFENLLNAMPVGVFVRDFKGNMHYQNSYINKAFGRVSLEKINISDSLPKEQAKRFLNEDAMVSRLGNIAIEEQLTDNNGIERTYVTHKFKFIGPNKTPLVGGISIDISKRKQAEHNYYVLTKAINNLPVGVLITSPKGIVEFFNPEFNKINLPTKSNKIGEQFICFTEEYPDPHFKRAINDALYGNVHQCELSIKSKQFDVKWYSLSVAPVLNRHSQVAHIVFVFNDVTERKKYEKDITIAKTQAEESERLKTAFLSNLSHEIRTPLNAIQGFSTLLNSTDVSDEDKRKLPKELEKHSNSLLEIINDLIDISAIETNQFSITLTECQLNKLLVRTFNDFRRNIPNKNLKTHIKLGVAEDSFTVLVDPQRLSQVIHHLLSNAIKFTKSGFIEFGYIFKDPKTLLFYFIDTGVGLSQKEQEFIFDPFRQADDSNTRDFNGLGLGLAIAKNIVERHGGKIWVNSQKGQGATFYFTLPYVPVREKFEEYVPSKNTLSNFKWNNKTILLADDADSNYKFIQALIKPTGANLLWAKNGREAIDLVKSSNSIDLILMDIVMPEVDGFEAAKKIKSIDGNVKIVCQTAYPSPENRKAWFDCGMDEFLAKPIASYKMMEVIDEFISNN